MKSPALMALVASTLAVAAFASLGPIALGDDPRGPAPQLFPSGYHDHDALTAALRAVERDHPGVVRLGSLGKTLEGRDIWLVTLGPKREGATPAVGPAVLVVANLEADHVVGSHVALGLVRRLAKAVASQDKAVAWLDRCTLYVVPRLNPDGAERALKTAPAVEFRTNARPIDRDRDGKAGEDGPDDLDGDGVVVRMRHRDASASALTLVPDPKDPRILRPADRAKGERGVFAEEPEGRDDDGDGLRNEDPPGGVNLNRNWPHRWTEFDPETGFSPASEPAVHKLIAFAFDHPEIAAVWSFSLNDSLRDEPKKPGSDLDDADLPLFAELTRAFHKATDPKAQPAAGGSPAGKGSPAPGATTDGSLAAWAYHQFGAVGLGSRLWFTPEVPAPPKPPEPPKEPAKDAPKAKEEEKGKPSPTTAPAVPEDGEARWLLWNDRVAAGRAFVPLHPVEHPTLGKVEVGGWRPGVRLNPPIAEVTAIEQGHLAFLNDLADRLPKLVLSGVKVEPKGGGLFAVTAAVENSGYLPTALAQGVRTRKAAPVLVRLVLDPDDRAKGAKLLTGDALERIDALAGSGGRREFHWLVLAPAGLGAARIEASCPRAGRVVAPLARP